MKSRPILFSAPMVSAILSGRKTQTRRIINPQECVEVMPEDSEFSYIAHSGNHFGQPGDQLWVRESYYQFGHWEPIEGKRTKTGRQKWQFIRHLDAIRYLDSTDAPKQFRLGRHSKDPSTPAWHKRLARFMPRTASRLTLEVTAIHCERLHDISESDANAEGCPLPSQDQSWSECRRWYQALWESINGPGSWDANPYVWVVEFKLLIPI